MFSLRRAIILAALPAAAMLPLFTMLTASSDGMTRSGAPPHSPRTTQAPVAPRAVSITVRARRAADLDRVAVFSQGMGYAVSERVEALTALRLRAPAGVSPAQAVKAFVGRPGVLFVEPSYTLRSTDVPADPLYAKQAAYLQAIHAPEAWNIEKGNASVLVAVLDSGIDLRHPDLQGRVRVNSAEIPNNGIDDDANGCIDDVNGCAFVEDPMPGCASRSNGDINDDLGHGTFVSGIIAANGNNVGIVGVARNVTILPVKVLDCQGSGDALALAEGIIYAARAGARLMNISLGGEIDSAIMREAVHIVHDQYGALIIAAAGNSGARGVAYPARYPEVLAVGAADSTGARPAAFTTSGTEVDVVAVGQGIIGPVPQASCAKFLPCLNGAPYAMSNGTSFAAPQVAGLAALMLAHRPGLSGDAILNSIKVAADPLADAERPEWAGSGRVNMLRALQPQYRLAAPGVSRN